MKITLVSIYQLTAFNANYYYPLALYYLKAHAHKELTDKITVSVKNFSIDDAASDIIHDLLADSPDLIGFSCYVWNIKEILEISRFVKKLRPALKIVIGGPQVTHTAENILTDHEWVDVVVRGEGEETFAELLKYYVNGDRKIEEIKGITYRADGTVRSNEARPLIKDLDDIPSPFTEGLDDRSHTILMETQRGCPFECAFCDSHKNFKSVRYFSVERVKKELSNLFSAGVKKLFLADSTFNLDRKRAKEILRYIASINKGTDIITELRPELLDREMVDLLEKAGVKFVEFGLQSINPTTLKHIGRRTNLDEFEKGIKLIEGSKIEYVIQMIIGLPGDDLTSFKRSVDYVLNLAPQKLQVFDLQLLPGTALYNEADRHGYLFHSAPPHVVIQNETFSYTDMMKAKELAREAYLMYPRNYGILARLSDLKPSDLIEKWIAWRKTRIDLPFCEYERIKGITRLSLFSRFMKELLSQNASSAVEKLYIKAKCNLLASLIIYKYVLKVARRSLGI